MADPLQTARQRREEELRRQRGGRRGDAGDLLVDPMAVIRSLITPQVGNAPSASPAGTPISSIFPGVKAAARTMLPREGAAPNMPRPSTGRGPMHDVKDVISSIFNVQGGAPAAGPRSAGPAANQPFKAPSLGTDIDNFYSRILDLEGGMKNGKFQRSSAGAWGPAQLMPGTAPEAMQLAGFSANDNRWQTDAQVNIAAGKAYYQKQLETFGDPALAAAAYNAGPGRVQEALARGGRSGWVNFLPAETQNYVKNFNAKGGGAGSLEGQGFSPQFRNPFDPSMGAAAIAEINNAEQQALQPFKANIAQGPRPEFPDAPELPTRDFSKTDAMLKDMAPLMIDEVRQKQIKRANLFAGLSKGLASIPEGSGLGLVLGNIGAGMLAGRAAGDAEVQKYMDDFDNKMAAYKLASFNYEGQKSESIFQEATNSVKMMYQHNLAKFNVDAGNFDKDNLVDVQGSNIIVRSRTDNGVGIQTIPIAPIIKAQSALQRAQQYQGLSGQANQGASIQASAENQYLAGLAGAEYARARAQQASGAEQVNGINSFITSAGMQATELVKGGFAQMLVGEDSYAKSLEMAKDDAIAKGHNPGEPAYSAAIEEAMITHLTIGMLQEPALRKRVQEMAPTLWDRFRARRLQEGKTRTTVKPGGQTTTVEEY